ncbi:MAG: hypothetical protein R2780_11295 [Crocinitomicaceae bacterium]|nr:hypothetical protein [Crocinitomicaceae bacterium]
MSDEILDQDAGGFSGSRPQFLTVLCILTWVGSGWGIIGSFVSSGNSYSAPMWYILLVVACNAATAYGAYEMWNLKKKGLMIYTAGEVAAMILPAVLFFAILPSSMAGLATTALMIAWIFPIAFLVMYWMNAKHLND